jgi:flagellar hook-associated protein 3 FlgL
MRVSELQKHQSFVRGIEDRSASLVRIQEELAAGRSLFKPSENVTNADQALRTEELLAANAQYQSNIEDALTQVSSADSSLQSILDLISEISTLALSADNSSQTEVDRQNTALQIDQKLEDLMSLVNSTCGDRYQFGGYNTTTSPYTVVRDADGHITGATVNEETIAGKIYRRVGQDEDLQINVTGDRLFQPVGSAGTTDDLFYVIAGLRDTIANNNTPPEGSEDTLSNENLREQLSAISNRITEQQTYLGAVGQRLQSNQSRLENREIQLTDTLEQAQGVDITDLVSRASLEQTTYEALASLSSSVLGQSLVDYLS